ncbi:fibronectin type III domain-containing protein [Umezawaea sp. NPDC059074]|uniref:fibronectin type III domain-containing protein n=1 Tax=Umezawaea sp. NPDC059074 TaxID=3346716 RepID=UPI0036BAA50B
MTTLVAATALALSGTAATAAALPTPTGLKVTGTTGTSVALVWKASSGATGYDLLRDGALVAAADIPSAMSVGLKPSTSYTFRVRARNASGAVSADSAPVTVRTGSDPGGGGGKAAYAGARSSSYGISPFPTSCGWEKAMRTASGYFAGSTPAAVWIVGNIENDGVSLQFPRPNDGKDYGSRIAFASTDKHEAYLKYFDTHGVKVWLQVEPGFADMATVIDLVLKRYAHHPSVVGFGVDVEWYNPPGPDLNDPVTDALAEKWEKKVKSVKSSYTLFLKHFDQSSMPPTYRGGIVFVDDSQFFDSTTGFLAEMKAWADRYYPNPVMYQIGYQPDKKWWNLEAKPVPKTLGTKLASVTRQDFGVVWVDFTLRDVFPTTC